MTQKILYRGIPITEERAIPNFVTSKTYELPENCGDEFRQLIEEHKDLFCTTPGKTTLRIPNSCIT